MGKNRVFIFVYLELTQEDPLAIASILRAMSLIKINVPRPADPKAYPES